MFCAVMYMDLPMFPVFILELFWQNCLCSLFMAFSLFVFIFLDNLVTRFHYQEVHQWTHAGGELFNIRELYLPIAWSPVIFLGESKECTLMSKHKNLYGKSKWVKYDQAMIEKFRPSVYIYLSFFTFFLTNSISGNSGPLSSSWKIRKWVISI